MKPNMYQLHPHLARLIRAMRLEPVTSPLQNPVQPTFYLRGRHMTVDDLKTDRNPYNMTREESRKDPSELLKHYKSLLFGDDWYTSEMTGELGLVTKDRLHLYKQGYQNVIGKVAQSTEAKSFLYNTVRWRHHTTNDNAAQLLNTDWELLQGSYTKHISIQGGMQSIPKALIKEFLNTSSSHSIKYNRRLACIRVKQDLYQLIFIKTRNVNGNVVDIRDSSEVCTHKVILALPPKSLRRVEWKPYDSTPRYRQSLHALQEYPVIRVYFIYGKLWRNALYRKDIYTDLPIRHYKYLGKYERLNSTERHHAFMVAEVEANDLDYIKSLIDLKSFDGENVSKCNDTRYLVADVSKQIAKLCDADLQVVPMPEQVIIIDWTRNKATGSWYNWKRGVKWDGIDKNMTKPQFFEDVYFVGGLLRENVEGVLDSVDNVIDEYFIKGQ